MSDHHHVVSQTVVTEQDFSEVPAVHLHLKMMVQGPHVNVQTDVGLCLSALRQA